MSSPLPPLPSSIDETLANLSTYFYTTTHFKNPLNPREVFKPFPYQRKLYNVIDYGIDIETEVCRPTTAVQIIIVCSPRQYGKSMGTGSLFAALLARHAGCGLGVMSNEQGNSMELVRKTKHFAEQSPLWEQNTTDNKEELRFSNGSFLESFGQTPNIRGHTYRLLVIDEAAQFSDTMINDDAMPTVSTAGAYALYKLPDTIMLSTPAESKGVFHDYFRKGLEMREIGCRNCLDRRPILHEDFRDFKFPSRLMPNIPACPKCGHKDFEYVYNYIRVIHVDPYEHPWKSKEEINRKVALKGNTPGARREYLGEFVDEGNGVFSRAIMEACCNKSLLNRLLPEAYRYVMGVDFGKMHDATVISIGHQNDNVIISDHIKILPAMGGMEYAEAIYYVLYYINAYTPAIIVLDATGIGDPIVEQLNHLIYALQTDGITGKYIRDGIEIKYEFAPNRRVHTRLLNNKSNRLGFVFDIKSKLDLIENILNLFQRNLIQIPHEFCHLDVRTMWEEFLTFGYDYSSSNRIIYGTQRGHDDTVIAVSLMAWGCRERPWMPIHTEIGGEDSFVLEQHNL